MTPFQGVGAGLLPAPADLPEQLEERDLDAELVELLCEDGAWVEQTFRDIVATSWAEPPRGGAVRKAARPGRNGAPRRRHGRRDAARGSQWVGQPRGRQRSPPVAGAA
ncbi:MAG TPA: hypothetical protein VFR87_03175 [Nocardioidaceae bacterium]|nr:hypothetical protein [Nocardioidaceae bacterium]